MKIKRILITILTLICATCCVLFATACSHSEHTFNIWKFDDDKHWLECSCGEKADKSEHNFTVIEEKVSPETGEVYFEASCECGYRRNQSLLLKEGVIDNLSSSLVYEGANKGYNLAINSQALSLKSINLEYTDLLGGSQTITADAEGSIDGDLYFGNNESEEFIVNAVISLNAVAKVEGHDFLNLNGVAVAVLRGGEVALNYNLSLNYVGLSEDLQEINNFSLSGSEFIDLKTQLENLMGGIDLDAVVEDLSGASSHVNLLVEKFMLLGEQVWQDLKKDTYEVIANGISSLATIRAITDGYEITYDFDKLKDNTNRMLNGTIKECVDYYFGEGTFTSVVEGITGLLDLKIGDITGYVFSQDFTINEFESAINAILTEIYGTPTTIAGLMGLENLTLSAILNTPELQNLSIGDLIVEAVSATEGSEEVTVENLKFTIGFMLNSYGNMKYIEIMGLSLEEGELEAMISTFSSLITQIKEMVEIKMVIDKEGAFIKEEIKVSIDEEKIDALLSYFPDMQEEEALVYLEMIAEIEIQCVLEKGEFSNPQQVDFDGIFSSIKAVA